MKITRSTSRISINGTTFISETTPRLPPTIIPIIHLVLKKLPGEEDTHSQREQTGPFDELRINKPREQNERKSY
jgi:hypothetical protein